MDLIYLIIDLITQNIILILLCFASFLAGFIDSIVGGGGLISVPSLILAGIEPHFLLGTNKFAAMFGTATALFNFIKSKKIIWKIALYGVVFSLIGSGLGTKAILYFDQKTVSKIIIWLLPITAIIYCIPKKQIRSAIFEFSQKEFFYMLLFCFVIGFYDGFFGPATGTLLILGFHAFWGMNLVNASAISKLLNLASNIGSFIIFAFDGKILYSLGIPMAFANILGGYLGSFLTIKIGQKFVKIFMPLVFVILFISLIIKTLQN